MAKSKPKIQKRLAKLVLAALLCTGGVQTFFSPSVAEAGYDGPIYGTVTKDGATYNITKINGTSYYHYEDYMSGDSVVANEKELSWDTYSKENDGRRRRLSDRRVLLCGGCAGYGYRKR